MSLTVDDSDVTYSVDRDNAVRWVETFEKLDMPDKADEVRRAFPAAFE